MRATATPLIHNTGDEGAYAPKPTGFWGADKRAIRVYDKGARGAQWDDMWIFDRVDDGAFRVKFHTDASGIFFNIALRNHNVHPYIIAVDDNGQSYMSHAGEVFARKSGIRIPKSEPVWLWVRFHHGNVDVGSGPNVGHNTFMSGTTTWTRDGGYNRFAIGKLSNDGAFELLDVNPMELRRGRNQNTRHWGRT